MAKRPPRPHPPVPLSQALEVPRAIADNNGGRPMNRILLAEAMKVSPSSSGFRDRVMASFRYGLTEGNYNAEAISLTSLGETATKPRHEHEGIEAEREAFRRVPIFAQLLEHFANNRLPDQVFLKNTLERDPYGIDPEWSSEVVSEFVENARRVGYLREMNGSTYVVLEGGTTAAAPPISPAPDVSADSVAGTAPEPASGEAEVPEAEQTPHPSSAAERPVPVQIFVAHGRSPKPLEQLKRILNEWQVPFLVAVDEPHAGRPISEKVADLMRACSAGIFIFTADDEFTDHAGQSVFRPSQNVIYELGAASLLYGRKIVVFKERGVSFPSDFSDLGWIEFDKDALDAKAMDLLRELIELKALRLVSSASE